MRSFTYSEHIARTPDQLFAYMLDFRNAARWRSLVRSIDVVGDGPIREGTQILLTMDLMGKVRQALSEIWVYDPWLILPFILRGHRARYVDQLARLKAAAEGGQ